MQRNYRDDISCCHNSSIPKAIQSDKTFYYQGNYASKKICYMFQPTESLSEKSITNYTQQY